MGIIKRYRYTEPDDKKPIKSTTKGSLLKASSVKWTNESVQVTSVKASVEDEHEVIHANESTEPVTHVEPLNEFDDLEVLETKAVVPQSTVNEAEIRAEIRAEIMAEFKPLFDDFIDAINGLKDARDTVINSSQKELSDLAVMIAEKVIAKTIEQDPTVIQAIVSETFEKISGSDRVTFKINPLDSAVMSDFQPMIESRLIGVEKITIQQDSTIKPGGCIIETDLGFVDASISEKMQLIMQSFKQLKAIL